MTEKHYFADVDLPFHVWVREGCRWVLRDTRLPSEDFSPPAAPPSATERRPDSPGPLA